MRDQLQHPGDAALAVWFHDAVYDPRRSGNEQASASLGRRYLKAAGSPPTQVDRIASMILDTRHHGPAASPAGALVADADLAILAAPEDEFDAYERAIREEYSHLSDAEFDRGRKQFVETFLLRPRIYQTTSFSHLESMARENLQRSVGR